jgi:hypothetical protein
MTAPRDFDRLLAVYLEDGPTELARDSYEAVDRRIQRTRQRAGFGPWRDLHMSNNLARAVLGVAAAVVAAVIGAGLLRPGGFAGTGSPTASPSLVSGPSASPLGSSTQGSAMAQPPLYVWPTGMAPGTYTTSFVWDPALQFTFTVPAGWRSLDINVAKNDRISLVFFPIDDVAGKTCASPAPTRAPVWTGDAVLAALGKLVTFDGPPSDARVAGRDARYVEFTARPVVGCATASCASARTLPILATDATVAAIATTSRFLFIACSWEELALLRAGKLHRRRRPSIWASSRRLNRASAGSYAAADVVTSIAAADDL